MSTGNTTRTFNEATPDERDAMLAVLGTHGAAERALDLTVTLDTMTDDCFQEQISIGLRCEGKADCAAYYEQAMFIPFPDHESDWLGMSMAKDLVVVSSRLHGTMRGPWMGLPSTNRDFSFPVVVSVFFRDGLMLGESWLYDAANLCDQLGLERADVLAAAGRLSSH